VQLQPHSADRTGPPTAALSGGSLRKDRVYHARVYTSDTLLWAKTNKQANKQTKTKHGGRAPKKSSPSSRYSTALSCVPAESSSLNVAQYLIRHRIITAASAQKRREISANCHNPGISKVATRRCQRRYTQSVSAPWQRPQSSASKPPPGLCARSAAVSPMLDGWSSGATC
jgi:hypothetical protein